MDKVKFWKKKDEFDDLDFGDDSFPELNNEPKDNYQNNFSQEPQQTSQHTDHSFPDMQDQFGQQHDFTHEKYTSADNGFDARGMDRFARQEPMQQEKPTEFFSGSDHIKNQENITYQTLNMKLDSIRAYLDLINSKLDRIEQKQNKESGGFRYT